MKKRALFAIMILSLLFLALLSLSATASAATHTVTFETSGLLNIPSQQVEDGGYATKPSGVNPDDKINEEKSLYFYRWYSVAPSASFTEADLSGKVFDFSKTKITKDTTIYAGYSGTMYIYIYDISNNRGNMAVESDIVPHTIQKMSS